MTKTQKPKTLTTKKRTPAFVKLSKSDKPEPPKKEIREKPTLQPIPIQVTASNETASRTTTNSPRNQEKPCIISKPPPIHVKSVQNFKTLCQSLASEVGPRGFYCSCSMNQTTIYPSTSDDYRKIIKLLQTQNALFHTYQLQEEKCFRIVIRNLHPTTPTEDITVELNDQGYKVKNITNAQHPKTKFPLPIFFIDLEQHPKNQEIFKLEYLCYTKIKIEEPYMRKEPPQCQRCQAYGHTKGYCSLPAKCVKCAGPHLTAFCTKPRETPATCANCNGEHPANFKGCTVFKTLKQLRNKQLTNYISSETRADEQPSSTRTENRSESTNANSLQRQTNDEITPLEQEMMRDIPPSEPFREPAAKVTGSYSSVLSSNPPSSSLDISLAIKSSIEPFLSDLKSLLSPILELLTKLVSALISNSSND